MTKITSVVNGESGLSARTKINNALQGVSTGLSLTGDGNTGAELDVNIAGVTDKAVPVGTDRILISDSEDSDSIKSVLLSEVSSGGSSGVPATAVSPASTNAVGDTGVSTDYARQDHQHPGQPVSVDIDNVLTLGADGMHYLAKGLLGNSYLGTLGTGGDNLNWPLANKGDWVKGVETATIGSTSPKAVVSARAYICTLDNSVAGDATNWEEHSGQSQEEDYDSTKDYIANQLVLQDGGIWKANGAVSAGTLFVAGNAGATWTKQTLSTDVEILLDALGAVKNGLLLSADASGSQSVHISLGTLTTRTADTYSQQSYPEGSPITFDIWTQLGLESAAQTSVVVNEYDESGVMLSLTADTNAAVHTLFMNPADGTFAILQGQVEYTDIDSANFAYSTATPLIPTPLQSYVRLGWIVARKNANDFLTQANRVNFVSSGKFLGVGAAGTSAGVEMAILIPPTSDDPSGLVGVSSKAAREDHKHPAQLVSTDPENALTIGADGLHHYRARPRKHVTDTIINPVTPGAPTTAEIQTAVTAAAYLNVIAYYTGDDNPLTAPTYVYHVDSIGVVTEIQTPSESLETIRVDASAGIINIVLDPATGSSDSSVYTLVDSSNEAKITVQVGESLNGTQDQEFILTNYPVGTACLLTDRSAGNWDIHVLGEAETSERAFARLEIRRSSAQAVLGVDLDGAGINSLAGVGAVVPFTYEASARGGFTSDLTGWVHNDSSSQKIDGTNTCMSIVVPKTTEYSYVFSTPNIADSSVQAGDRPVSCLFVNGVAREIYETVQSDSNTSGTPQYYTGRTFFTAGDRIQLGWIIEGGQAEDFTLASYVGSVTSSAYAGNPDSIYGFFEIEQVIPDDAVLAGLVVPEALESITVYLDTDTVSPAEGSAFIAPFNQVFSSEGSSYALNANGTITLVAGKRYRISSFVFTATVSHPYIYDFTNDQPLSPTFALNEAANIGGNIEAIFTATGNITVGLAFKVAETVQGATTVASTAQTNMVVEELPLSSISVSGGSGSAGEDNVQVDWEQTDNTQDDYIKNKPVVMESVEETTAIAHGFTAGSIVTTNKTLARANSSATLGIGIVASVPTATSYTYIISGEVELTSAAWQAISEDGEPLQPGEFYYVSQLTAGKITKVEPSAGEINNPVGFSKSSEVMVAVPWRPIQSSEPDEDLSFIEYGVNATSTSLVCPFDTVIESGGAGFDTSVTGELKILNEGRYRLDCNAGLGNSTDQDIQLKINGVLKRTYRDGSLSNREKPLIVSLSINDVVTIETSPAALWYGESLSFEVDKDYSRLLVQQLSTSVRIDPEDVGVDDQAASGYLDIGTTRMAWGKTPGSAASESIIFPSGGFSEIPSLNFQVVDATTLRELRIGSVTSTGAVIVGGSAARVKHWQAIGLK